MPIVDGSCQDGLGQTTPDGQVIQWLQPRLRPVRCPGAQDISSPQRLRDHRVRKNIRKCEERRSGRSEAKCHVCVWLIQSVRFPAGPGCTAALAVILVERVAPSIHTRSRLSTAWCVWQCSDLWRWPSKHLTGSISCGILLTGSCRQMLPRPHSGNSPAMAAGVEISVPMELDGSQQPEL